MKSTRESQKQHFKTFIIGALLAISGLCSLMLLELYQPESVEREILSISSIVAAIIGGIIAFKGYISLAIIRFKHFIDN